MSEAPVIPEDRSPADDSLWATWELLRVAKFDEDIQPTISCGKAMELIESLVASRAALKLVEEELHVWAVIGCRATPERVRELLE